MNISYKRPPLTYYQREILDAQERFTICEASTKTGKTASHIVWLFEETLKLKPGQNTWWIAPVYSQAEIAFTRMRNQISDRTFFDVNLSKLKLTLPNGAICSFKSAQDPDNLYGEDVYAAVFDEASRAKEQSWFALRSTLTATNGKCKIIGNARGKKNWMYRLGAKARAGEPDYKYFRITAYDAVKAGILKLEEVEQAKRDLPEYVFKELYLAEPNEDGANPFNIAFINKNTQSGLSQLPVEFYGIDIAKSVDYTVIVGLDKNGRVAHFERFQKDWAQTKQTILRLKDKPTLIDSTGVGDSFAEDLHNNRHNITGFKFGTDSKQKLMTQLSQAIQSNAVGILDGVMKDELESFEFVYNPSTGNVKYSAPSGLHDDTVCALALAFKCLTDKQNLMDFDYDVAALY
jgi:phage FluMu gp28-like protein